MLRSPLSQNMNAFLWVMANNSSEYEGKNLICYSGWHELTGSIYLQKGNGWWGELICKNNEK